jgi:hypothetical protein
MIKNRKDLIVTDFTGKGEMTNKEVIDTFYEYVGWTSSLHRMG